MRTLTIGMLTYDDFDGVYFTIQSLRLHHPEAMSKVEFLIVDNSPESKHGQAVKKLTNWIKEPIKYLPYSEKTGTSLRNQVFEQATTEAVLCLDSHVLLYPNSLIKLIQFFEDGLDKGDLLQGPMLADNLTDLMTHMEPVWRAGMWGIWGKDERGRDLNGEPFEIPAHGMGLFACRKASWPGFNPRFKGFGGEECYIHEKFRRLGRKTRCLPFLRWLHRFPRPAGVPYPVKWGDRIHNYLIAFEELTLEATPVLEHFRTLVSENVIQAAIKETKL